MKFVSADGVHVSGFVIANGRLLVHTSNLLMILLIKLTRVHFKSVYVHERGGREHRERNGPACVPETIPCSDVLLLNLHERAS
uniref:Uncharacterized protein n=1 Tax=Globisporangium ultimum (strain ATCC 200006 / CBS 805.95 / DAOM BR144) TaxID=431595 RepID=K3WJ35_GLOUD